MSQISEIIKAIGNISVSTLSETPIVFGLSEATESVRQTPARVVFPLQTGDNEGHSFERVTLGGTATTIWTVADLMLFSPANKGTLQAVTPELAAYVGNYLTVFNQNYKLGLKLVTLENMDSEWNKFVFPEKSKNAYFGALMILTIKEILT